MSNLGNNRISIVRAIAWSTTPPTIAEVRVCQWWWHRTRDGGAMIGPSVINLDIDRDGHIYVPGPGSERFLPEDWGTEWAPCLPPVDGNLVDSKRVDAEFIDPPANPTTLGDVWIGTPEPTAALRARR